MFRGIRSGIPMFFRDGSFLAAIGLFPLELTQSSEVLVDLVVRAFSRRWGGGTPRWYGDSITDA